MKADMLGESNDYSIFAGSEFREFFSRYTITVSSTRNLGLSIGIMIPKLRFHVIAHMSAEAKEWKKELLRSKEVAVGAYENDYGPAVEKGCENLDKDPMSCFVYDENSLNLFLGYAAAGHRVRVQIEELKIEVDETYPLFVYIPCGIGGVPEGITYGLKEEFGNNVHCFFIKLAQACGMLLGMATGEHDLERPSYGR